MAYTHYDRLTALDTAFLDLETASVHMHVGAVGIFDAGALAGEGGGIDFDQVLRLTEAGLRRAPRFRQRLRRMPVTEHPVWVDDENFNLLYHVRHTALPIPGDVRRLKRLAGRIMSQKLERDHPLWELWFVEGLEGNRFAVVSKVHHCLIDGISGVDLLGAFMGRDPDFRAEEDEYGWMPRPAPSALKLLGDELWRRARLPARTIGGATGLLRSPGEAVHIATGFAKGVLGSLSPASETPFNVPIGPHRRFDWTRSELEIIREIRNKHGGTLNDVVLACVAGAVRRYLEGRDVAVDDLDFRVSIPVSTRTRAERGRLGNRVAMMVTPLPVSAPGARERMARVIEETSRLKASGQAEGTQAFEELSDWTLTGLITGLSRLSASRRAYNLIVTNVPGPRFPVYLNGARMLESYPLVPLFEKQALGIALFSYDGWLHWGFNADWEALPDLHDFVQAIEQEFETLRKL